MPYAAEGAPATAVAGMTPRMERAAIAAPRSSGQTGGQIKLVKRQMSGIRRSAAR